MQDGRYPAVNEPFDHASSNWHPNWLEATWPYVGSHTEIYDCPTRKRVITTGPTVTTEKVVVGYSAKGAVTHFGGRWVRRAGEVCILRDDIIVEGASILRPQWSPLTSTPSIPVACWVGWMYFNNPNDINAAPSGMLTDKPHGGGQNLAYVDGHAVHLMQKRITSLHRLIDK
jgi:prepilin-type processing-associated H-X9-DG protein